MEEIERSIAILTLLANKTLEGSTKTALLFAIDLMKERLLDFQALEMIRKIAKD